MIVSIMDVLTQFFHKMTEGNFLYVTANFINFGSTITKVSLCYEINLIYSSSSTLDLEGDNDDGHGRRPQAHHLLPLRPRPLAPPPPLWLCESVGHFIFFHVPRWHIWKYLFCMGKYEFIWSCNVMSGIIPLI
jgi:hypothetical protein